jgi:hypothetical protein
MRAYKRTYGIIAANAPLSMYFGSIMARGSVLCAEENKEKSFTGYGKARVKVNDDVLTEPVRR